MIFNYLKYIRPIWYFHLRPQQDWSYFPTEKTLKQAGWSLEKDPLYKSSEAQQRDLAWRAFQQGFIWEHPKEGLDIWTPIQLPVPDEYRFIRKNFHPVWAWYCLVIRCLSFKNPFREIRGFWKSVSVKREIISKNTTRSTDYEHFSSNLIAQNPLVSVIIPTLNRYDYLRDVFKDLENQTYKNFEVIVVDQTDDFQEEFYKGWNLNLNYWYQEEKALWKARNEAIKSAKGEYILLYDDDSLVEKDWIEQHLKTLDFFNAAISSGVSISVVGGEVPTHYSYFRWSDQIDTGNVLLKKSVFQAIGLFDRQFEKQRMGDGEFGLRAYLHGFKNISNPYAQRLHLKVAQGGLRQMGSWDALRPKKFFAARPIPSVLYFFRKYFPKKYAIYEGLKMAFFSFVPYKFKGNKKVRLFAYVLVIFLFPFVVISFFKSWRIATTMLHSGQNYQVL